MNTRESVELETRLLPSFPGFAVHKRLMFIPPAQHVLRGFWFDVSGWDKRAFYVDMFFMPLCVPKEHVDLTFGSRVDGAGWNADQPDVDARLTAAMLAHGPFLASLQTPKDVAEALKSRIDDCPDPHLYDAIACSLARAGETTAALAALDRVQDVLDVEVPWQREIADRSQLLRAKLAAGPSEAQQQLEAWELETVRNLGLEAFR